MLSIMVGDLSTVVQPVGGPWFAPNSRGKTWLGAFTQKPIRTLKGKPRVSLFPKNGFCSIGR